MHKFTQSEEVGGFVQSGHFADKRGGGLFRCGRPHFLDQKTSNFFEFRINRDIKSVSWISFKKHARKFCYSL